MHEKEVDYDSEMEDDEDASVDDANGGIDKDDDPNNMRDEIDGTGY